MFARMIRERVDAEYRRLNIAEGRYSLDDLAQRKDKRGVRSNQIKALINVISALAVWWVVSCLLMLLLGAAVVGIVLTSRGY